MMETMRQRAWPSPRSLAALLALLAALLVALPLVIAPRADAYVYWTNPGAIGRADLDGSGVDQSFVPDVPCCLSDVAVDADHLYWSHSYQGTSAIGRANLDGTGVDQSFIRDIPGSWSISGIAVGPEYLYWTSFSSCAAPCTPAIGRARLDGTQVDPSFIGGLPGNPGHIAVDAAHLYWTADPYPTGTIGRAKLDGTGVDQSFIPTGRAPVGIAVDGGHLYWADSSEGIGRARVDGSEIDPGFVAGTGGNLALAVDAAHIYFSDRGYRSSTIWRANLDGTGAGGFLYTAPQGLGVTGVAVDGLGISQLQGTASAKRTQRQQGKKVVFKVKVTAEEQLTANATGTITVNSAYKLKPKSVEVARDDTETLKLKPKKAKAKKVAAALKRGKEARAKLTVTLTDAAANSATETLRVRLKR